MKTFFHYATVSDAILELRAQGFKTDFNLDENRYGSEFISGEFEITDVYRYEGDSDPADEASVYAIILKSGIKGVVVAGYGNNAGIISAQLLKKRYGYKN